MRKGRYACSGDTRTGMEPHGSSIGAFVIHTEMPLSGEASDDCDGQPGGAMAAALDEDFRVHKAMTFAKRTSP